MEYEALGLKVGLEIHQQLDTHKLFCNCPSELQDIKAKEFMRQLRPTQSEMGEVDKAALAEAKKHLRFRYQAPPSVCLVEADEEPPHNANEEAIDMALEFAVMVDAKPVNEIQFMRKIVIDGSNTAGFQRTALIAMGGTMNMGDMATQDLNEIGITTISLEEDAARKVEKKGTEITYRLDRLGIPLIEVTTEPDIKTPSQARDVALRIGSLLRATKKVKRGIGTIREDLNISITEGARVEIKGVQELRMISHYVEEEVKRQLGLIQAKKVLEERGVDRDHAFETKELTEIFQSTNSRVIKRMLEKEGIVQGVKLKGYADLLGSQLFDKTEKDERSVLGPELAGYLNIIGIEGLFHSDELPGYGITEEEVENVKKALNMGELDAFVLVAEKRNKAEQAGELVISRASLAVDGVLEETRDAQPDGKTMYSRPLPGRARMYPETDVRPIRVTKETLKRIKANLPEMPEEKLNRFVDNYELSSEQARQLINVGYDELFEALITSHQSQKMRKLIAKTLLNTLSELESEGLDISKISDEILENLFKAFEAGKFAKEGISEVLRYIIENGCSADKATSELGLEGMDLDEMEKIIVSVVNERIDFIKEKGMDALGPLMGIVMKKLRGKVDGESVSLSLKKKIQEICG